MGAKFKMNDIIYYRGKESLENLLPPSYDKPGDLQGRDTFFLEVYLDDCDSQFELEELFKWITQYKKNSRRKLVIVSDHFYPFKRLKICLKQLDTGGNIPQIFEEKVKEKGKVLTVEDLIMNSRFHEALSKYFDIDVHYFLVLNGELKRVL